MSNANGIIWFVHRHNADMNGFILNDVTFVWRNIPYCSHKYSFFEFSNWITFKYIFYDLIKQEIVWGYGAKKHKRVIKSVNLQNRRLYGNAIDNNSCNKLSLMKMLVKIQIFVICVCFMNTEVFRITMS